MLRLALASLRARWLSLAGSVVALTAGVALVTAAGATINAATAQRSGPSRRLHADLLVQGEPHRHTPEGYAFTLAAPPLLPLSTVDTVAAVPGVVRVVADRSFPVPGGTGYGWTSASLTPYAATYLAQNYGLQYVGYYLSAGALLSLFGLLATHETKDARL